MSNFICVLSHAQSWSGTVKLVFTNQCCSTVLKVGMTLLGDLKKEKIIYSRLQEYSWANLQQLNTFTLWTWGGISSSELSSGTGSWWRGATWPSSAHPPIGACTILTTLLPVTPEYEKQKNTIVQNTLHRIEETQILLKIHQGEPDMQGTCGRSTVAPLGATMWWGHLLAKACTPGSWGWRWNGTGTRNCHGESIWTGKIPAIRSGFTPHFIRDTVTAFIALLSVPCVSG